MCSAGARTGPHPPGAPRVLPPAKTRRLQAVSMALAIRARMVHAPEPTMRGIVGDLTNTALQACYDADRKSEPAGHG